MQRIGILGGTFDPPHIGHLILAQYTAESIGLDKVLFVPAGEQPFKPSTRSGISHRLAMLQLATQDNPQFEVSRVDVDRPGPHYTADMLPLVQAQFPDAQLYFLMGGDNLRDFPTWTRPREIYQHARLAVMRRSDEDVSADMHDETLLGLSDCVDIVNTPLLSIWLSSSHIVERLQRGLQVRYLVPDAVLAYVHDHNLYKVDNS
ncbi:MAG: nicotinate-nucleotide adenylyltransferase [Anaerolineae bacterium]|nr:nicotinate-nucleotide adenylyltransferase [Anaerolineae bacterium]MDQ7036732.1 nicotinate-nucleotide adenylyltransferase [Anaerolineae bacterium]